MKEFHPVLSTIDWLVLHAEELILGSLVAAVIVAIILVLRLYGRKIVVDSGDHVTWKTVVGRVLARTSIVFMVAAALDTVTTYAEPGPKISRVVDIFFTVAAGLQAAFSEVLSPARGGRALQYSTTEGDPALRAAIAHLGRFGFDE